MGTKRRVLPWYIRRTGEYVCMPPKVYKRATIVFSSKRDLMEFARAARLILRQVGV